MADLVNLSVRISDLAPFTGIVKAMIEIAEMADTEDGFNPRTMQRIAAEALSYADTHLRPDA